MSVFPPLFWLFYFTFPKKSLHLDLEERFVRLVPISFTLSTFSYHTSTSLALSFLWVYIALLVYLDLESKAPLRLS